jgi:DNA-binding NtrC family response regulator
MGERSVLCVMLSAADCRVCEHLRATGWNVHVVDGLRAASRVLKNDRFLVGLLVDDRMDDEACAEVDQFLRQHSHLEWVGAFDPGSLASTSCREIIVDHLFDHHTMPLDAQRLAQTLGHALGHAAMRERPNGHDGPRADSPIIGQSPAARELLRQTRRIAKVDAPVLITGESGSGKELTAQEIHRCSRRASGPFVPVNCGAIQATLIQSELFGHAKGAFTGADRDKRGLFEAAGGGTLFLDEIGDLSLQLQINLLRFLQEKTISRVGSTHSITVDVRVIAATNVDLEEAVSTGAFREDLFYRLNVLPLRVPPLRERKADIELLANHFFSAFADDKSPRIKGFSRAAILAMHDHDWPGNVRELINRVRRAMVMAEGRLITPADLALDSILLPHEALDDAREKAERTAVSLSLQEAGRNITQAAKRLGVSRMTLYRLMAKHGITG